MPGTSFSVDLLVVTPNQLRKIDLSLSKTFKDDGSVQWVVVFGLQERKKTTDNFADVIKLTVKINPSQNDNAESTAKKGFDDAQTNAAFIAADSAKAASKGQISTTSANADVRRIIAVRGT